MLRLLAFLLLFTLPAYAGSNTFEQSVWGKWHLEGKTCEEAPFVEIEKDNITFTNDYGHSPKSYKVTDTCLTCVGGNKNPTEEYWVTITNDDGLSVYLRMHADEQKNTFKIGDAIFDNENHVHVFNAEHFFNSRKFIKCN
jgi:hypothetical protein